MKRAIFDGQPCWRVVATRHPPIALFEKVAPPEAFDALYQLEGAYSPHYDTTTLLASLPRSEWVHGPGSGYVMAPFAYRQPSRFSDGSFGVFYAGLEETTAIREVAFHRGVFLAMTREAPFVLEEQVLRAKVSGTLVDIRGARKAHPEWYAPSVEAYGPAQDLGSRLWRAGEAGLTFSSVRHAGGGCLGIYRPKVISGCRPTRPLRYLWDGDKIAGWA